MPVRRCRDGVLLPIANNQYSPFAVVLVLFLFSPSLPFLMVKMWTQGSAIFTGTLPQSYLTVKLENRKSNSQGALFPSYNLSGLLQRTSGKPPIFLHFGQSVRRSYILNLLCKYQWETLRLMWRKL